MALKRENVSIVAPICYYMCKYAVFGPGLFGPGVRPNWVGGLEGTVTKGANKQGPRETAVMGLLTA